MNDIKSAVMTLALCAVCAMLFHFLLPEGGVSRTAKVLIGLVMLCAVCTPLFRAFTWFRGSAAEERVFSRFGEWDTTFAYTLYEQEAERAVREACEGIIKKHTAARGSVSVSLHILDEGAIKIEHVRITFETAPEGRETIKNEIADACGVIPEIRVETVNE